MLMMMALVASPIGAAPAVPASATAAASLAGEWRGALAIPGGASVPLVLHVAGAPEHWTATLDSPAQGATGLPVAEVVQDGTAVRFALSAPQASFAATLSPDGRTLTGTWSQGAASLPLVMTRAAMTAAIATPARPQTPVPPFPYRAEEVGYDNAAGHAHFAGTLTLPAGGGRHPAVLLVTGSGQQDRDEAVFGHRPFLVWADALTRRGVAVLRVDDRGVGGSTGEVRTATTADFAGDAAAGVAYLRGRTDINPHRIGVMGHSEGGVIAPMVAARNPAVAFIVLLAGSGMPGEALMLEQKRLAETAAGLPPAAVDRSGATMARLYEAVKGAPDQAAADAALAGAWRTIAAEQGLPADAPVPPALRPVASPWLRWFVAYDPRPTLAQVRCPLLAVGGSRDVQVPAAANLAGIRAAVRGNPRATVVELPGLNHLLQTATTGRVDEYARIEETVAPAALRTVTDWIVAQVGPAA